MKQIVITLNIMFSLRLKRGILHSHYSHSDKINKNIQSDINVYLNFSFWSFKSWISLVAFSSSQSIGVDLGFGFKNSEGGMRTGCGLTISLSKEKSG